MKEKLHLRMHYYRERLVNHLVEIVWEAEVATQKLIQAKVLDFLPSNVYVTIYGNIEWMRRRYIIGQQPLCLIQRKRKSDDVLVSALVTGQEMSVEVRPYTRRVCALIVNAEMHLVLCTVMDKYLGCLVPKRGNALTYSAAGSVVDLFWDKWNYALPCNLVAVEEILKAFGRLIQEGAER